MNRSDERVLDGELETCLRLEGLPLPLAVWATWVTRAVTWQRTYTLRAEARRVYEAPVPWFAQHPEGKLARAQDGQGDFVVQGVVIVDGYPQGVHSPKLVLATVSIQPDSNSQARVSIETAAKISALSRRSARRRVVRVCEAAADEIMEQLAARLRDAR